MYFASVCGGKSDYSDNIAAASSRNERELKIESYQCAGKGLTSWLSFMVSNCEFVTFPLVSWVRCGT